MVIAVVVCAVGVLRWTMRAPLVVLGALHAPLEALGVVLVSVGWYRVAASEVYMRLVVTVLDG